MYRVLSPIYEKTSEVFVTEAGREGYIYRLSGWKELGTARDMADAYEKFPRGRKNGYSHVLEQIGVLH
jgi:hypothetical protein